jgi:hypothetical protein
VKRAVVVAGGRLHVETVLGSLAAAGFEAATAPSAAAARALVDAGAVVVVAAAECLDGEAWKPFASMSPTLRRSCLVALVGEDLSTWDGGRAFSLGVDVVVRTSDLARLGELVTTALAAKRNLVAPLDPAAAARLGG